MTLVGILPYIQIGLSVLLVVSVLLQQTGASIGGAFGGPPDSTTVLPQTMSVDYVRVYERK